MAHGLKGFHWAPGNLFLRVRGFLQRAARYTGFVVRRSGKALEVSPMTAPHPSLAFVVWVTTIRAVF